MIEFPHGFTGRTDGDFKDAGVLEQVHGDVILKLDRRPEGRPKADGSMRRFGLIEIAAWMGRIFIGITLGAIFAGVYAAALTALIERIASIINFITTLFGNF